MRERDMVTRLRSALWLPVFDELADPAVVARLAAEAEQAGWHGFFVWDHVNRHAPIRQVADPWITLAAMGPWSSTTATRPRCSRESSSKHSDLVSSSHRA